MIDRNESLIGTIVWVPKDLDAAPYKVRNQTRYGVELDNEFEFCIIKKYDEIYKTKEEALKAKLAEYNKLLKEQQGQYSLERRAAIEGRLQDIKGQEQKVQTYHVWHYYTAFVYADILADSEETAIELMKEYEENGSVSYQDAEQLEGEDEYSAIAEEDY